MKLKDKETGEVVNLEGEIFYDDKVRLLSHYNSLAELCEKYEDYKEPKEHWAIDQFGEPINVSGLSRLQLEKLRRYGNDFPSENETIKALEWLKAFTILKKDTKGHKFNKECWNHIPYYNHKYKTFSTYAEHYLSKNILCFKTEEDALESIKKHRKEWLTYLGVEDGK